MKTGWRKYATRKDTLDTIATRGLDLTPEQSSRAWKLLMEKMLDLADANAPRLPKFNDLLLTISAASVSGKRPLEAVKA